MGASELERLRDGLEAVVNFPINEDMSAGWHFAEVRYIARTALEPSDDECRCNKQARELGGEALRRVESEQGRLDDARREP